MARVIYLFRSIPLVWRRWPELIASLRGTGTTRQKLRKIVEFLRQTSWPWLSSKTPSRRAIRIALWHDRVLTPREHVQRFLQRNSSLSKATGVFFAITIGVVLLAVAIGSRSETLPRGEDLSLTASQKENALARNKDRSANGDQAGANAAGALLTFAEVLGGTAGILFAVIIFSVQFHGERLGEAAFVAPNIARRQGFLLAAAVFLAVIAANVLVGLCVFRVIPGSAVALAWIDCVLALSCALIVIWLLHENVESIGGDIIGNSVIPSLSYSYEQFLEEAVARACAQEQLRRELAALDFAPDSAEAFGAMFVDSAVRIPLAPGRRIGDVNLNAVRDLRDYIRLRLGGVRAHLLLEVQQETSQSLGLVLSHVDHVVPRIDPDGVRLLTELLGNCVLVARNAHPKFIEDFEKTIQLAVDGALLAPATSFRQRLALFHALIESDVHRPETLRIPPDFAVERPFLVDPRFHVGDLKDNVLRSRDPAKVKLLFDWGRSLVDLAIESRSGELFESGAYIVWAIYRDLNTTAINVAEAEKLGWADAALHSVLERLQCRHIQTTGWDPRSVDEESPFAERLLGLVLRFTKIAIEQGVVRDVGAFFDRVFEYDSHRHFRQLRTREPSDSVNTAAWRVSDLHTYGAVVIAGWCVHLAETANVRNDAVIAAVRRAADEVLDRRMLFNVWQRLSSQTPFALETDTELDVVGWELEDSEHRPGIGRRVTRSSQWRNLGFIILGSLLPDRMSDQVFDQPQGNDVWVFPRPDDIAQTLSRLASNDWIRANLLSDALGYTDAGRDAFIRIVDGVFREAQRASLSRVLLSPIETSEVQRLTGELNREYSRRERWINYLRAHAASTSAASGERIHLAVACQRSEFIANGSRVANAAGSRAEFIVMQMNQWVFARIAERSVVVSVAERLDCVRALIESASQTIRNSGGVPSAFVPMRLQWDVIVGPDWPLSGHSDELRELNAAMLGDIPVFGLPNDDTAQTAAFVVDLRRFFVSASASDGDTIEVNLQDISETSRTDFSRRSAAATTAQEVPNALEPEVILNLLVSTGLGVGATARGSKIELPFLDVDGVTDE